MAVNMAYVPKPESWTKVLKMTWGAPPPKIRIIPIGNEISGCEQATRLAEQSKILNDRM